MKEEKFYAANPSYRAIPETNSSSEHLQQVIHDITVALTHEHDMQDQNIILLEVKKNLINSRSHLIENLHNEIASINGALVFLSEEV
jgi:hypothetical protein